MRLAWWRRRASWPATHQALGDIAGAGVEVVEAKVLGAAG